MPEAYEFAHAYQFAQFDQAAMFDADPDVVLAEARDEAEQLRLRAHAEGEAAGYAAGIRQGIEDCAPLGATLQAAADGFEHAQAELLDSLTHQAADLAIAIAEQIVTTTVKLEPERLLDVTRMALRRLTDRSFVTLAVNPYDLELLRADEAKLIHELGGIDRIELQADRRIERGGVVVTTPTGEIDCSLDAQFETVREIVRSTLRTSPEPAATDEHDPS